MTYSAASPTFGTSLSREQFAAVLRSKGSPAAAEADAIFDALDDFDPAVALGQFAGESGYGRKGYATTTRNLGNILFYEWTKRYGATPFAPGNGYTYSRFPSWTKSAEAYAALQRTYRSGGFTTIATMSAHWLGDQIGTKRSNTYLGNILAAANDAARAVTTTPVTPPKENPVTSTLKTQPLLALGAAGTVLSAIIVYLVDAKAVSVDAGNALVQVAALALPLALTAIGRQFVTPNARVDAAVEAKTTQVVVSDDDLSLPAGYDAELWANIIARSQEAHGGADPKRHTVLATYQADIRKGALDKPAVTTSTHVVVIPATPTEPSVPESPAASVSMARTAFVREFGAAPSVIWGATLAKITAAGLYDGHTAKDKATWRNLANQYGGKAALVAYDVMNGTPGNVAVDEPADMTANLAHYFTGVYGIDGSTYRAYRDGQLLSQVVAGPTFDTAAWGASLGLNPNGWYD